MDRAGQNPPPFPPTRHILQTLPHIPLPPLSLFVRVIQIAESLEPGLGWLMWTFLVELEFFTFINDPDSDENGEGKIGSGASIRDGIHGDGMSDCFGPSLGKLRENRATVVIQLVWGYEVEFRRHAWFDPPQEKEEVKDQNKNKGEDEEEGEWREKARENVVWFITIGVFWGGGEG